MPTGQISHAPRRLRPKEVRPRSRVSGSVSKLRLFSFPESRLRAESDTGDVVSLFFSRAQRGLSRSATSRVVSAATRIADPRRMQHRATILDWSLVFPTFHREATVL